MMTWKRFAASLVLGLFTACGAPSSVGTGTGGTTPPPPPAGSHPPRWEYYCVSVGWLALDQVLKAAGTNGWELVTAHPPEYCFKRPMMEANAAPAPEAPAPQN